MGLVRGEWTFPKADAPSVDAVVDALQLRSGVDVSRSREDGDVCVALPLLKEILFEWQRDPERISVHGPIPPHPYLWTQLNAVMIGFGGRPTRNTLAFLPESPAAELNRPWAELTSMQRFALRLRPVYGWRPIDRLVFGRSRKRDSH